MLFIMNSFYRLIANFKADDVDLDMEINLINFTFWGGHKQLNYNDSNFVYLQYVNQNYNN